MGDHLQSAAQCTVAAAQQLVLLLVLLLAPLLLLALQLRPLLPQWLLALPMQSKVCHKGCCCC